MAIISTDQATLNTGTFAHTIILEGVVISGAWNMAADGDGTFATGDVYGQIFGGIQHTAAASEFSDLFIGASGIVNDAGGAYAIELDGGGHEVTNFGMIGGSSGTAIHLDQTAGASTFNNTVANFGVISGTTYGIHSVSPTASCFINNAGSIHGGTYAIQMGRGTVNNSGTIMGNTNAGSIIADGTGLVTINNSGTIVGGIEAFSSATLKIDTRLGTITGSIAGNAGNDTVYGSAGDNVISTGAGNDFIDGYVGADAMSSGAGNDTFVVDDAGDKVTDSTGTDTIRSHISFDLSDTAAVAGAIEVLRLLGSSDLAATGAAGNETITGNMGRNAIAAGDGDDGVFGKAGADALLGEAGNDTLDGGKGGDAMEGGAGNDSYYVDNIRDTVDESTVDGGGTDTVFSTMTWSLTTNTGMKGVFENLTLTGSDAVNATGNALANVLFGNAGNNTFNGLAGSDTLTGAPGSDRFVFSTILDAANNVDTITDFKNGGDIIVLDDAVFTKLAPGSLSAANFASGPAADADDYIVYDKTLGKIYYDADGKGTGVAVLFATVTAGFGLTESDFAVI